MSNALQVVSGAAEVLAMDPTPAAVEKRTASIVGQAMHATVVLTALSGFVKAPPTPAVEVDLRQLADHVLALRTYTLRKLRIDARVDGDAAVCLGSPRALLQVALNLCINAEQAVAEGRVPTLRLSTSVEGDTASLLVTDNGPGMSEAARAQLFAWPPAVPRDADGLGIGLMVSKGLLALDGGSLGYEPGAGGGAVFTMRVPRPAAR